jgi:hypothetical protein
VLVLLPALLLPALLLPACCFLLAAACLLLRACWFLLAGFCLLLRACCCLFLACCGGHLLPAAIFLGQLGSAHSAGALLVVQDKLILHDVIEELQRCGVKVQSLS